MEKFVDITINPDGSVSFDFQCYKGNSCEADLKKLAKAMGLSVVKTKKKQDYYQDVKVKLKNK